MVIKHVASEQEFD